MSGRGNCCDTSMVLRRENSPLDCFLILLTFCRTIKSDLVWPVAWQSRPQAENAAARYIDGFHNPVRRHSSTGFQSPIAFTRKAREVSQTLSAIDGRVQRAEQDQRSAPVEPRHHRITSTSFALYRACLQRGGLVPSRFTLLSGMGCGHGICEAGSHARAAGRGACSAAGLGKAGSLIDHSVRHSTAGHGEKSWRPLGAMLGKGSPTDLAGIVPTP
jgi:putative transposase